MADLKKITVEYDDGSTREITNGFIAEFDGDEMIITTTGFSKLDMMRMTHGILASVEQMGMMDDFRKYMDAVNMQEGEDAE